MARDYRVKAIATEWGEGYMVSEPYGPDIIVLSDKGAAEAVRHALADAYDTGVVAGRREARVEDGPLTARQIEELK